MHFIEADRRSLADVQVVCVAAVSPAVARELAPAGVAMCRRRAL